MINKAIEKLTKEMMKLNNPFAQAIEEHLTEICTSDAVADKILQPANKKSRLIQKTLKILYRLKIRYQNKTTTTVSAYWKNIKIIRITVERANTL